MKPSQGLILLASILMLAGIAADTFLHLPLVSGLLMLVAAVCMLLGIRSQRRQTLTEPAAQPSKRVQRFVLLAAVFAFASVSGFFLLRYQHPEQSATLHISISAATFLFGVGISYRQYFRTRLQHSDAPATNDRNA